MSDQSPEATQPRISGPSETQKYHPAPGPSETRRVAPVEEELVEAELVEAPAELLESVEERSRREAAVIEKALRGKILTSESLVCEFVRVNPWQVTIDVRDKTTGVTLKLGKAEMEHFTVSEPPVKGR